MKELLHRSGEGTFGMAFKREDIAINEVEGLITFTTDQLEAHAQNCLDHVQEARGWPQEHKCTGNVSTYGPECARCERWKDTCLGKGDFLTTEVM